MTIKIHYALLALTLPSAITCRADWLIGSTQYQADTIYHAPIGPGVTLTSINLSGPAKQSIHYAEVDLTNPYIQIRTPKALNTLGGSMTLSSYASTLTTPDERYIIGTNADFGTVSAQGLIPCGPSVSGGTVYYAYNQGWYGLSLNENKRPLIDKFIFQGTASTPTGYEFSVNGLNTPPTSGNTTLFTSHYGQSVTLDENIPSCSLENVEGKLGYCSSSTWKVVEASTATTRPLAEGKILLCGTGAETLQPGDQVSLDLNSAMASYGTVLEMTGGCPAILKDGKILDTSGVLDHLRSVNPRTAVGYTADGNRLLMMVVDGRSSSARGMTSIELAQLMLAAGCSDALNLDGGGSSEIYSIDLGIINSPSDGAERKITNSLWAVSLAPADSQVKRLALESWRVTLPQYARFTPTVYGYNQYGVLVDTNFSDYTLAPAGDWASVSDDGQSIIPMSTGVHQLTISYGDFSLPVEITVKACEPQLRYSSIVIDDSKPWTVEVEGKADGVSSMLSNNAFEWSTSAPETATVDQEGRISGIADGQAKIYASLGDTRLELTVKVEIPTNRYMPLPLNPDQWTASGSNITGISLTPAGDGLSVSFTQQSSRGRSLTLKPRSEMKLWSLPDSLVMSLDGDVQALSAIDVKVRNPHERAVTLKDPNPSGTKRRSYSLAEVSTLGIPSYPITLESITLKLPADSRQWNVTINQLNGCYDRLKAGVMSPITDETRPTLIFQQQMILLPDTAMSWEVLDMCGRTLMGGHTRSVDTSGLRPGVYLVRIMVAGEWICYKFIR